MKRVLIFAICLFMLVTGCSPNEEETEPVKNEVTLRTGAYDHKFWETESVKNEVTFRTGAYDHKFWETDKIEDLPGIHVIPDEDAAVKIATAIYKELPFCAFEAQSVFFDEEDEIWIVAFYPPIPETGPVTTGPCHEIALRKKDGKVLGIIDY